MFLNILLVIMGACTGAGFAFGLLGDRAQAITWSCVGMVACALILFITRPVPKK